jgi:hypothetical protein
MLGIKMRVNNLCLIMMISVILMPMVVNAEIYKWKDKDGQLRYTDTPPPYGVKAVEVMGKKNVKFPTANPTMSAPPAKAGQPTGKPSSDAQQKAADAKVDAAGQDSEKRRRQMEEIEKKNKSVKDEEAKQKQLNCEAAKANYQTYSQGGRVYHTNEKGERVYVDDQGLAEGAAKAQQEMSQYCS